MYREFFRLEDYPFRLTADSRYFYMGESHKRAKAYLKYILHIRDGVALITGEAGVGKTVLLEDVLSYMEEDIVVARIKQTQLTTTEFLLSVCLQFGLQPAKINKATLIDEIQRFVFAQHCQMKTVVLIVDEAHNLSLNTLEELRMLANLEKFGRKLMQIILVGQPQLNHMLSSHRSDGLSQMVRLSCMIEPLSIEETAEYINHRLAIASRSISPMTVPHDLLPTIMCYTGGVPRLINILCDMMLIAACLQGTPIVDTVCLHGAIKKLGWPVYLKRISAMPKPDRITHNVVQRPIPLLIIRQKDQVVGKYLLSRERTLIGRIKGLDIRLDDRKVSRQHAQIININGRYFIQDLNSTNGTYVRSEPVKWHPLSDHDHVRIGDSILEYRESLQQADTTETEQTQLAAMV
jgi:general secretion pathway protein A